MVAKAAGTVVKAAIGRQQAGGGVSKQKILSWVIVVAAAVPSLAPQFDAWIGPEWIQAITGVCGLLVILSRATQQQL